MEWIYICKGKGKSFLKYIKFYGLYGLLFFFMNLKYLHPLFFLLIGLVCIIHLSRELDVELFASLL